MLPRPKDFSLRRGEFQQHQQTFASCCSCEGCAWFSSSRPVKAQKKKRGLQPSGLHTEGFQQPFGFQGEKSGTELRELRSWTSSSPAQRGSMLGATADWQESKCLGSTSLVRWLKVSDVVWVLACVCVIYMLQKLLIIFFLVFLWKWNTSTAAIKATQNCKSAVCFIPL